MRIKVLGVSGSPRDGNTATLVRSALMGAEVVPDVETEYVGLAGKRIDPCNGCLPCLEEGACVIQDDMQPLYPKLLDADAIIIGSPVYFGSVSALCKAFLERVQGFGVGEKKLRLKIGGAIATGGSRNGGQEAVLSTIHLWCHINDMIPVGVTAPVSQLGVTASTSFDTDDVHRDVFHLKLVDRDISPNEIAWLYGRKISTVAKIMRAGVESSGLDLPDLPYGFGLPKEFPEELRARTQQPPNS